MQIIQNVCLSGRRFSFRQETVIGKRIGPDAQDQNDDDLRTYSPGRCHLQDRPDEEYRILPQVDLIAVLAEEMSITVPAFPFALTLAATPEVADLSTTRFPVMVSPDLFTFPSFSVFPWRASNTLPAAVVVRLLATAFDAAAPISFDVATA